jgi:hypothetical protein
MIEKYLKAGPMAQCPNPECKYKHPIEAATPETVPSEIGVA